MRKTMLLIALAVAAGAHAEQKNVQYLTNLSDRQLGAVMNNMSASLGVHCDFCHVRDEQTKAWDWASDAKQEKKSGREMIRMVLDLNTKNFNGRPIVGCYTCHMGHEHPASMVPLPLPAPAAASAAAAAPHDAPVDRKNFPAAKDLVAKYVTAIGGEGALKKLTAAPLTAKGTRTSMTGQSMPIEVYRSGGNLLVRATPAEGPAMAQSFGANGGWATMRQGVRTLTAAEAHEALEAATAYDPFNGTLPENARVFGKETIDGHEAWSVGSQIDEHTRQRVWFDANTGLVLRRVVTVDSPVGRIPTQTDYEDYRDVAGVKVPFTVRVSTTDVGQSQTRKYSAIELGAKVDETMFAAPPK